MFKNMRKSAIYAAAATLLLAGLSTKADACTNVVISAGASADGSVIVSYALFPECNGLEERQQEKNI